MNNESLYQKIQSFELSDPHANVTFESKLAEANSWTLPYAQKVAEEYRKFLYLTQVRSHMVCPSDEVDQAWHLHLTQTVSYQKLCDEVLGGFLHHYASKGGPDELMKHKAMYSQTLRDYEEVFGHAPDAALWPDVQTRFTLRSNSDLAVQRGWMGPRSGWQTVATALVGYLFYKTLGQFLWPAISGPLYMAIYIPALVIVACIPMMHRLIAAPAKQSAANSELDPYEVACLVGGEQRVMGTAVAKLVAQRALVLEPKRESEKVAGVTCKKNSLFNEVHTSLHPVERELFRNAPDGIVRERDFLVRANSITHLIRQRLINAGLAVEYGRINPVRGVTLLALAVLMVLGVSRFIYGVRNYHDIGYLFVALAATLAVFLVHKSRSQGATPLGEKIIIGLASEHSQLKTSATSGTAPLLALGFALFGSQAVMANQDFAGINFFFEDSTKNKTGQSDGSEGCGGGGCGGGGCGGCGG